MRNVSGTYYVCICIYTLCAFKHIGDITIFWIFKNIIKNLLVSRKLMKKCVDEKNKHFIIFFCWTVLSMEYHSVLLFDFVIIKFTYNILSQWEKRIHVHTHTHIYIESIKLTSNILYIFFRRKNTMYSQRV